MLLNETFQYEYLMLEYVASPMAGQEYYLPQQFREALIAWLRYMDIVSIPSKTHSHNSNVLMREKQYFRARRVSIAKWKPIRPYDMYQVSQEMSRMAIKS